MIAHERFQGNLRLQVPGKVFRELGPTVSDFDNKGDHNLRTLCFQVMVSGLFASRATTMPSGTMIFRESSNTAVSNMSSSSSVKQGKIYW